MPLINFSGIASGIDSNALIEATSDAARAIRVAPNERKIEELEATNTQLGSLKSLLTSLQTIVRDFASINGGVVKKSASSTDETVVTASASNQAASGTYAITASNLATNATLTLGRSTGYTSSTEAINSNIVPPEGDSDSDVTITVGQGTELQSITIRVTSTMTLGDFASSFNDLANDKATATVVNVGSESTPNYKVVITSANTGLTKGAIGDPPTIGTKVTTAGTEGFNASAVTQAENAIFSITGIGTNIERGSNTISDVIAGVTITLKADSGTGTITISNDVSATQAKIQEFVDKYNEIIALIQEQNKIERIEQGDNVANIFSALALTSVDDNSIVAIRNAIIGSVFYNSGDSSTATNEFRIFADLGITTDSSPYNEETRLGGGTLKFDTTQFGNAMSKEPNSVNQIMKNFGDTAGLTGGTIDQFIRFGGLIETTVNSNKDQITDLNERIADAESAILQQETTMRARFARLESLIGGLQAQQSQLSSVLASLPRIG